MSTRSKTTMAATLTGLALLTTGCSSGEKHANEMRPASTVIVSASVSPSRVTVAPTRLGAGPITLVVANMTNSEQTVTLESADDPGTGGAGTTGSTQAIEPAGTASLKADVDPGRYSVRVESDEIAPAAFEVGAPRESSQNDLLLP